MSRFKLEFTMQLEPASELLWGNLRLIYPDAGAINYLATSGCTGWQQANDQWARARGPLPEGFDYKIPTTPYHLDTRGVEGDFFHITPDPVSDSEGGTRSELGIHFDANVPGSAGCIVLRNRRGWLAFCDRLSKIAALSINKIPLTVRY